MDERVRRVTLKSGDTCDLMLFARLNDDPPTDCYPGISRIGPRQALGPLKTSLQSIRACARGAEAGNP
jgi:hypothetical protein